jgi:HK97 family phage major capsid protein
MTKIDEINKRLLEIVEEGKVENADLDALTEERDRLLEERNNENERIEKRKALIEEVVNLPEENVSRTFEEPKEARKMEKTYAIDSMEYKSAWLNKMKGGAVSDIEERALVVAAGAIPTETMNKVVEKMEHIAPILGKIDLTTIPSNISIPVESVVSDAAWVAMGTAATDGTNTLTTVELAAYKLIKTVEIGADVSAMAIPAFESYLVNSLAKKMAKALENAVINGTGSAQPTGLLASGIITNTGEFTKAAMTYADILAIIGDLPDHGYREGASFVMPSALFYSDVLPALTDKGSGLDVQAVEKMKILSYDVILCDRVAADTIIFGNLKNYAMNLASDVKVESDKSTGFRSGSTVYRAMALVDGKPVNVAAFNAYTRATV